MTLDQFYTKPDIAKACCDVLFTFLARYANAFAPFYFIEPSAGEGTFLNRLPANRRIGIDIDPHHPDVETHDFLAWQPSICNKSQTVVVGNPPFGHRSHLAVKFFNHATTMADTIAFIVPVVFRKYRIHKQLDPTFQWVDTCNLPLDAFYTCRYASYSVNTEFQIWTRLPLSSAFVNKRQFKPPPISHPDFILHQYNNTKEALKVFNEPFDFAVPSQGYQDYTRRETRSEDCEKHKQWLLFKTDSQTVRDRLWHMDYETLAMKNVTTTPGFRKNDVVQAYVDD